MNPAGIDQYLRRLELNREQIPSFAEYPFCLPALQHLRRLDFHPRVTFIIGENGTGKSTILEAIAAACGFKAEGGAGNFTFAPKSPHSVLNRYVRLIKGAKRPRDGFFLRTENFSNPALNIDALDSALSFGPLLIESYGRRALHEQSHGESFWAVFLNRFEGQGLYILDEPEAALSPSRQMSLITRMHQLVREESQFIIATHSPILMAYPDATIYQIGSEVETVNYEDTEYYQVMRAFINNPRKMLDILME